MAKRKPQKATDPKKTGNKRGIGYGKPPEGRKFQPGNPGGPGRPPGETLTDKLKRILATPEGDGVKADRLMDVAVAAAQSGDFRFFKEIIDRVDGKVPDRVADANGNELVIRVLREPFKASGDNGDGDGKDS